MDSKDIDRTLNLLWRRALGIPAGEPPQPVYSVRFDGRELWGESAEPGHTVAIDLWESYLEPAQR